MTNLRFAIIRDLITDVRQYVREGNATWAERGRQDLRRVIPVRHTMRLDRFGWPLILGPDRND